MQDSDYQQVAGFATHEIAAIKNSRFIGYTTAVYSDEQALEFVSGIKKQHPDARHWCWAYQLRHQKKTRFFDDGEPNGSAGKPILAPLIGRELFDSMVVVVRYFGGVKLGIGGLVRAYSQAANEVLDVAKIITVVPQTRLKINYRYEDSGQVAAALASLKLVEVNPSYTEQVESELLVNYKELETVKQLLNDYTAGRVQARQLDNEK